MKIFFLHILFLSVFAVKAQDKIYLLNGDSFHGRILEVSPEEILLNIEAESRTITINRQEVLLIEYKKGIIEVYNKPAKDVIYSPQNAESKDLVNDRELFPHNFGSLNTLALCNADIAGFYERILQKRKIGVGIMGAYNFNIKATASNFFIAILSNAKKNYDLGIFLNVYVRPLDKKNNFYYGVLCKYTDFSFTSVKEEITIIGGQISSVTKFTPSKGSQLATIFTIGSHSTVSGNFFVQTLFGLGGFGIKGAYKEQFNHMWDQNSNTKSNVRFLPKAYLGLNAGFKF